MPIYDTFARVYDEFMDQVPYDDWVKYLEKIWQYYDFNPKLILDLGCGTGNIAIRLSKLDKELIGVDISEEMLGIATEKSREQNQDILFLNQDMREFELYGTVDCVVSLCDSMNYLLEEEDLLQTFRLVNNYLNPGGFFIFDLNTEFKYNEVLGSQNFSEVNEENAYIWENYYDEETGINEYAVTMFIQEEKGLYKKFEEYHYQKAYKLEAVKELLIKAGFEVLDIFDAFTTDAVNEQSERAYFIAKEITK